MWSRAKAKAANVAVAPPTAVMPEAPEALLRRLHWTVLRPLGYALGGTEFGHGGYGGANGFADPATGLAVGLTKNFFSPNGAEGEILDRLRKAICL